ncbi:protein cycle isoform X2 [Centruroides vittatus]
MNEFDDDMKMKLDSDETKRQNHSEIEKRRRDKMNTYITELSSMIPMCNAMSRKLDKLTVLRMAVQHMKTLRGSMNSYTEGHYKPSFLSDDELKHLILEVAEGFLFVISCDRGRILYVSESVSQTLNYSQSDLLGQNWFDILHPKDIAKVKEQLSSSDLSPKEKLIDAKTMLPVKTDVPQSQTRLCPGARRSFFCRMKCKAMPTVKEEADTTTGCHKKRKSQNSDRKYCVIHCTGYLKSWTPIKLSLEEDGEGDNESCNLSCLVAVGRAQQGLIHLSPSRPGLEVCPTEFISRHAADGKFLFVDQRATLILGYLPQELIGTSCYENYHQDDIAHLAESHRLVLQSNDQITTQVYQFRTKEGSFVCLQTKWKVFQNPWTKEFECIVAINTMVPAPNFGVVESSNTSFEDMLSSNSNSFDAILSSLPSGVSSGDNIQRFSGSRIGAVKIGKQIADETELQKGRDSSTSSNDVSMLENIGLTKVQNVSSSAEDSSKVQMRNHQGENSAQVKAMLNGTTNHSPHSNLSDFSSTTQTTGIRDNTDLELMDTLMGREMLQASYQNNSNEGNDEAAMAVIMSLLEADAGLGGPVDFSGLPWPLP